MSEVVIDQQTEVIRTEHTNEAARMLASAKSFVIDCMEMAEACAEDLRIVKAKLKVLEDKRTELKAPVLEAGRKIDAMFKELSEGYLAAEAVYKKALIGWQDKERIRIEAERKAAEEAARKIREEQERQAREAAEAARKAEEEARKLAEAGKAEEAAAAQAQAAEASQAAALAQETADVVAHMAPAPIAAPAKIAGISTSEVWKCECTNLMDLVKAIAKGEASLDLITFNQPEANKRAKALKSEFKVPGIRTYSESNIAARAAKA